MNREAVRHKGSLWTSLVSKLWRGSFFYIYCHLEWYSCFHDLHMENNILPS
jgi:hypothetical protein